MQKSSLAISSGESGGFISGRAGIFMIGFNHIRSKILRRQFFLRFA
jgi:hypothetical protein